MRIVFDEGHIKQTLTTGDVQAELVRRAGEAADRARDLTPSRDKSKVISGPSDIGAYIGSNSSFYHWWEWGTRYSPAYAPLRTGVEAAGLRFVGD